MALAYRQLVTDSFRMVRADRCQIGTEHGRFARTTVAIAAAAGQGQAYSCLALLFYLYSATYNTLDRKDSV